MLVVQALSEKKHAFIISLAEKTRANNATVLQCTQAIQMVVGAPPHIMQILPRPRVDTTVSKHIPCITRSLLRVTVVLTLHQHSPHVARFQKLSTHI